MWWQSADRGNVGVIASMTLQDLGPTGEAVWYVTQYPPYDEYVRDALKLFDKEFHQLLGVDAEGVVVQATVQYIMQSGK